MKFNFITGNLTSRNDSLLLGLTEGPKMSPWAAGWAAPIKKAVEELLETKKFSGKLNETFLFTVNSQWIVIVGLGKQEEISLEVVRQASASGARRFLSAGIESFSRGLVPVPDQTVAEAAQAATEGTILGTYQYSELKSSSADEKKKLKAVTFVLPTKADISAAKVGVRRGEVIAQAVCWVRDMANRPSNRLTPSAMAKEASQAGRRYGFKCRVLGPKEQKRFRMNAFLGVARGSEEPSQFIIAEYKGKAARNKKPLVWIGKGITFDSGGICIKPSAKMEDMKFDMCGGAAVLGAIRAVAALKLPVHIIGLVPATENLPGGSAQKPGDVVETCSGKTIEVINTDAEGRLILADALSYAQRYKPEAIVDIATLTGACIVALGSHCMALMGNEVRLNDLVRQAGSRAGERTWELPLWPEYSEPIRSEVADVKNMGDGKAGTIIGGAFLKEFVGKTPWVHLDIAGVAWTDAERGYIRKGGTGVGVRLLVELASRWRGLNGSGGRG
ncbi:MAG: leucyl aminopeptidase [Candidatus Omnitrophica bacterium]|nr:leucyl aminopeptidase [Candidatus Omnitrophota bacterium]